MINSRYYGAPQRRDWKLTKMKMDPVRIWTTFDAGKLVPIWCTCDVLPGEEYEIRLPFQVRSLTPIVPTMDDAYLDVRVFYSPHRNHWDKFENFVGSNPQGYWVDPNTYTIPQIVSGTNGFLPGSVADYLRLPTKVPGLSVSAMPFRTYVDIYNNWYRSADVNSPGSHPTDSTTATSPTVLGDPITEAFKGGALFNVTRLPDYFSTATPAPIRANNPVTLPLPDVSVVADYSDAATKTRLGLVKLSGEDFDEEDPQMLGVGHVGGGSGAHGRLYAADASSLDGEEVTEVYARLKAQTSAIGIDVNELRMATQIYRLLARDAYGSRYRELIFNHFGTSIPDSTVQVPQYIGGRRYKLNMNQVAQTSATGDTGTPLGSMGAYSLTVSGPGKPWRVACTEWGTLMIVACIRVRRSYQQGVHPMWTRKTRLEHYWPPFAQLGPFPIYKRELLAQGTAQGSKDAEVFGYQEAWDSYRNDFSGPTGEMRSNVDDSLDIYHYADYYESVPSLSPDWLNEGSSEIRRTQAVQTGDQFFGEFVVEVTKTTPVPAHSEGMYMDHF